ncbi:site-specific integrase [Thalassomonas sp. RHCl1]|uniref:tyrosine-type recombinase/integrase n=1 Tax=Thalassomonas sp. RHCl1 TaxID=2995320 RepID=UPI00248A9298|nr:site-specific integrase [Thalassomonas sp. RHCl1]
MATNPTLSAKVKPQPIFDNLSYLDNPFQLKRFDAGPFIASHSSADDELDPDLADDEFEYAWKFIYSYNGSSATFNVYRRETERLLQWAWLVHQKNVLALKREDIESYVTFCQQPPKHWIGNKNVGRFKSKNGLRVANPDWRPFVTSVSKIDNKKGLSPDIKDFELSKASVQSIFAVLSSFYNFLIQEQLIEANPVLLIRQKSKFMVKNQNSAPVRRISNLQWEYVIETVEYMAAEEPEVHERSLFILNCLLGMYLRISELVADERSSPSMGDFQRDSDGHWWLHVIGKGNKSRKITVSDEMIAALKRYRRFLNLPAMPTLGEHTPLVAKQKGKGPVTSTRQIRSIVQLCFDNSYQRMKNDGLAEDAEDLKLATVHWLRHTGISEDVKTRPREHVRDDAGHSSMQTTDRYIESDARERHLSGRKKKLKELD